MANERPLNSAERALCRKVFSNTINYDKVRLSDNIGLQNRWFTTPSPYPWEWGTYYINVGRTAYRNCMQSPYTQKTLIHEMTHVWQGMHSFWAWNYVFNSLWHQGVDGTNGAYVYWVKVHGGGWKLKASRWKDFNVEQQALIIEDWFDSGMPHGDVRFPFVRDNILKNNNG